MCLNLPKQVKPGQVKQFYEQCDNRKCESLIPQMMKDYDRKVHPRPPLITVYGGLDYDILEPAQVKIAGTTKTYPALKHGKAIELKRCYIARYRDKNTNRDVEETCTKRKVIVIPQNTIKCYNNVIDLINTIKTPKVKKKRKDLFLVDKILALTACNRYRTKTKTRAPIEYNTLTPAVIAGFLLPQNADKEQKQKLHQKVRDTIDVMSRPVRGVQPKLASHAKKTILGEPTIILPADYQKTFDEFIDTEVTERKWLAFRKLFGTEEPTGKVALPEPQPYSYMFTQKTKIPQQQAPEGWRPFNPKIKMRKAPKRKDRGHQQAIEIDTALKEVEL